MDPHAEALGSLVIAVETPIPPDHLLFRKCLIMPTLQDLFVTGLVNLHAVEKQALAIIAP